MHYQLTNLNSILPHSINNFLSIPQQNSRLPTINHRYLIFNKPNTISEGNNGLKGGYQPTRKRLTHDYKTHKSRI